MVDHITCPPCGSYNFSISRKVLYFLGILSGVEDIFLSGYFQVLSLLNVWSRDIFEPQKNPIQRRKSFYK